jgi:formylglycine-generating enzyme
MRNLALAIACAAAACSSAPPVTTLMPAGTFVPLSPDAFPGAAKVLAGFDERTSDAEWQPHDQVLFAVQLENAGEVVRWLLHLEAPVGSCVVGEMKVADKAPEPIALTIKKDGQVTGTNPDGTPREWKVTSRQATVAVRILDAQGALLAESKAWLPADTIGRGLLRCIGPVKDADGQAWAETILSVVALFELLRDDDALDDFFWQVIEKPSLWSIAMNLGVSATIDLNGIATGVPTQVPPPVPPIEPAFWAPLQVLVNGVPALYVDLLATDASRPYAICGGVVAATARHPTRPDKTFRMQLLAARCGSAAPAAKAVEEPRRPGDEREVAGVKLCWCPAGRFLMGSPPNEFERRPDEDQVEVNFTRGFWISMYEVTQGQWQRVLGQLPGPLTTELLGGDDYPVGNVNFAEAETFCRELTELGRTGALPDEWEFRLPTEAQWEYACRAGTTTATHFGDQLGTSQANFRGKPYRGGEQDAAPGRATKVGSYPANAWGVHDMHGNIYEWCRDWYHRRLPGGTDPDLHDAGATATKSEHGDQSRVRRGGCWCDDGWALRTAFRLRFEPERRYDHIGFRVVLVQR